MVGNKPYFIGEIGINHNGDFQIVKKLIDASFACGWNCVKFQKKNPNVCVPEEQKNIKKQTPWGEMSYLEYKKKMEFGKTEYDYIDKYCKEKPIDWSASVWDLESLEFIANYDIPFIKIPSAKITDKELLTKASKTGKRIFLSTGMSTMEEITSAVHTIISNSRQNPVIFHCNSSYPTPKEEINLNVIKTLKQKFTWCDIGYSGHEFDLEPTVLAVALGAKYIERHITLSHELWGTDQKASLEILAMDMLKKRCEDVELILGSEKKEITPSETLIRKKLRGS